MNPQNPRKPHTSCQVKVLHIAPQDYGGQARLEYHDHGAGGDDIMPAPITLAITADAAQIIRPGAILTLTLTEQ